jgi:hypothetical protein
MSRPRSCCHVTSQRRDRARVAASARRRRVAARQRERRGCRGGVACDPSARRACRCRAGGLLGVGRGRRSARSVALVTRMRLVGALRPCPGCWACWLRVGRAPGRGGRSALAVTPGAHAAGVGRLEGTSRRCRTMRGRPSGSGRAGARAARHGVPRGTRVRPMEFGSPGDRGLVPRPRSEPRRDSRARSSRGTATRRDDAEVESRAPPASRSAAARRRTGVPADRPVPHRDFRGDRHAPTRERRPGPGRSADPRRGGVRALARRADVVAGREGTRARGARRCAELHGGVALVRAGWSRSGV